MSKREAGVVASASADQSWVRLADEVLTEIRSVYSRKCNIRNYVPEHVLEHFEEEVARMRARGEV